MLQKGWASLFTALAVWIRAPDLWWVPQGRCGIRFSGGFKFQIMLIGGTWLEG